MEKAPTVKLLDAIAAEILPDNLCDMGEPVIIDGDLNLQTIPNGQDAFMLDYPSQLKVRSINTVFEESKEQGIIRVILPYSVAWKMLNLQTNFYINYFLALANVVLFKVGQKYSIKPDETLVTAKRPGSIGNEGYFRELESTAGYEIRFFIKPKTIA